LQLPLGDRLKVIERQGPEARESLERVAFDANAPLEARWRAVTTVGRLYHDHNQEFMEKAMRSSDWYMRNAAIIVAPYSQRQWAVRWAKALLDDPALIVRTAAVEAIRQMGAKEAEDKLWQKLYSSENYHRGDSLWIRRHIAEALAEFGSSGDEAKFIRILGDRDKSLHPIAMRALRRITVHDFATAEQWTTWWARK
jgi:HEAT repeat protein